MKGLLATVLVVALSGCVTSTTPIDFSKFSAFSGDNPGNKNFDEVGPVAGSSTSWTFASCARLAEDAMTEMLANAKSVGANAVFKVHFAATNDGSPSCKRHLWPLLSLIPFWASSSVRGVAAKVKAPEGPSSAQLDIRPDEDPRLVARAYLDRHPIVEISR